MQETTFEVKTEKFQGPLDVLLELIEKKKLFINDISLAKITDDYIRYINDNEEKFSKKNIADFISVASTLLLIKSRSLLPDLELSEEEEEDIEYLEERLRQYKMIKDLSSFIRESFGLSIIFLPEEDGMKEKIFSPHKSISQKSVLAAAENLLSELPTFSEKEHPKAKVKKIISLEEMIESLTKRIKSAVKLSFKNFAGSGQGDKKERKVNAIVGFLAILELFKQGLVNLSQKDKFSDIEIEASDKRQDQLT